MNGETLSTFQARQGDVLVMAAEIPAGAKQVEGNGRQIILAEGEATGHAHAIVLDREADVTLYAVADEVDRWLRAVTPVEIVHQEHGPIPLPTRDLLIRGQLEYAPGEIRRVAD